MYEYDDVERVLAEAAANQAEQHMVEPIDEPDCHPMDYADVTGLWEEMYPEPEMQEMVDENGVLWYVKFNDSVELTKV